MLYEVITVLGAGCRRVGVTCDVLPVQQMQFLSKVFPFVEFVDIAAVNRELRSVKSEWELAKMAQSGQKIAAVFAQVPEFLRPGMRELVV